MRKSSENQEAFKIRVTLEEVEPPIWRSVLVEASTTLHELHRTIQMLFDWYDYHLYRFEIGDREFEAPDEDAEGEDATKMTLGRLGLSPGDRFRYIYDLGDDWVHRVEVEGREIASDRAWLPWVINGARRGPPEDCGGVHRYSEIQRILQQPLEDLDEDDQSTIEWLGNDFDPDQFNLAQARHDLLLAAAWGALRRKR